MIVVLGLPLKVATIILGCIFSMLFSDFRAHGPINIPTPPIGALIEFFHADAVAGIYPLPVSWYLISLLWVYLCFCMHIMSMLWSIADAISSNSCPILFKVLTLNGAICIVRLHFSNFCLSSVADFSNTEARAATSAGCAPFHPHEEWYSLDRWFGCGSWLSFDGCFYSHLEKSPLWMSSSSSPNWTIWSWPLNRRIHTPRTWLGIASNHQRVYRLAFTSTIEQVLVATPHKTPAVRPLVSHYENYTS